MIKAPWKTVVVLFVGLGVGVIANVAHSQFPPREKVLTLQEEVVKASEVEEEVVTKVLNALGPAIQKQLAAGKQVALPGLGVFRVVRIPAHRDLVGGRPVIVQGRNHIEFLPSAVATQSANNRQARPAVTVPPFRYDPLPGQTPSPTVPRIRTPSTRVR